MDKQAFRNPGIEYRGVTLWMLNDELEVGEIARQLQGFHDAGWGAVIGRTFNGLKTEYLGDQWMAIIDAIISGAKARGMRAWLQAGYMPSAIPGLDPATAHKGLALRDKGQPVGHDERLLAEDDQFAYVEKTETTVLDLLNADAVTDYLDLAYKQPWHSRFGDQFGKTVEAIWVDEPHFRPPLLPWSDRLPDAFKRQWGYDVTEHLPSLFCEVGDFRKVRHQYWRTVTGMFLEAYFESVGRWCAEHDIKFSGHLMGEDTLNNQIAWTGATMPCYEAMQLPGIDHLTMSLRWPSGKKFLLTPKQLTSAGNQLGKAEMLCEMYAVSSQGITFEDRKEIAQWMAVLGINYRCYHGSFYSMRGRRKRIYVPHLSHQQPWWPDNRLVADPFARLCYALRQGRARADVLLLHPVESAMCLYDPTAMDRPHDRSTERGPMKTMDDQLVDLCDNLLTIQRGFEFGDETLMARHGKVDPNGLTVGRMTYKVVVLPQMVTLRTSTLELLEQFAAAGGTILSTGDLPARADGVADDTLAARLAANVRPVPNDSVALKKALDTALPAEIAVTAPAGAANIWVHARQVDQGRLYYLVNTSRTESVEAEVNLRGTGRLEAWDLQTGDVATPPQRTEGECVVTRLAFPPVASHLLLLREDEEPLAVPEVACTVRRTVPLAQGYRLRRHAPNVLTLDTCRLRKGEDGRWAKAMPVIGVQAALEAERYAGPIMLQFRFNVDVPPKSLCVAVEDAADYRITVNGKAARYAGLPYYVDESFHPVDVAEHVVEGENVLELAVDFRPMPESSFALASLFEKKEGTELESIYLIGDFAVAGTVSAESQQPGCLRCTPAFVLTEEPETTSGDLSAEGYPFFAGRASLLQTVALERPRDGERVILELPALDAVLAKVRLNGDDAGAILWPPYELDVTDLVRDGDNEVEIELVGSLRNLLGPHHRSNGEPDNCWRTAFDYDPNRENMEHHEERESQWTDDYFFVHFGVRGEARLKVIVCGKE